jgi:RNA polymerase sigma-70 factor (ECF subfamily)
VTEQELGALMVAYQQGDLGAFEELYRALRPRLMGYLLLLVRNPSRVDDLLQETFLQLHRSRRTYMPGRPVMPWAFAIARHVHLADVRARSRTRRQEYVASDALPEIPVPAEADGLADRDRLQQALRLLPADQVEAVVLNQVWGFTFEEIGGMLGIRSVTAKVRAFRAMKRLREILGTDR